MDPVALVEGSRLFDRDFYLRTYRDVAASGVDPLRHYLARGVAEARNPNRLFDTHWYMSAHFEPGVERTNPLVHYILRGAESGCDPHPYFSTKAYLARVPSASGSPLTPLGHYLSRARAGDPDIMPPFTPYDVARATAASDRRLEAGEIARHLATMIVRPHFIVLVDGEDEATGTRDSLSGQLYASFETAASLAQALELASRPTSAPGYLVWVDAGDRLESDALYRYAAAINRDPGLDLIYADADFATGPGTHLPVFKPGWSPDYLEAFDYIGSGVCTRLTKAREALSMARSRYDFILRFTEQPIDVAHLERVILSAPRARWQAPSAEAIDSDRDALRGRLGRTGRAGEIVPRIDGARCYDIEIALRRRPRVSIVIPTAGKILDRDGETVDLIERCVRSILERSTYREFELIIVDNGDFDRDRLAFADRAPIEYVIYDLAEVNIAKKINLGAAHATGPLILILNDDVEVRSRDWLERLVAHFEKPHVGLVGARLLYPTGAIQHVGVAFNDGHPEHVSRGKPSDDVGYLFGTACVRNYLAVTGAVMMTTAEAFRRVGGFSEAFPIDYNDIDFALKYRALGLSVVYEPNALLMHYESVSFVKPPRPEDADAFHAKWGAIASDPFYNEYCLGKHPPSFEIAFSARRH